LPSVHGTKVAREAQVCKSKASVAVIPS
jgi:hypothetical protein